MESNKFFSKNDAKILYGIAVILMVVHHVMGYPPANDPRYLWVFDNLTIGGHTLEWQIGRFAKICVGIYALISGVGIYESTKSYPFNKIRDNYKRSWKRLKKFYSHFWLVFILFVPFGMVMGYIHPSTKDLILSFIGRLEHINWEWWYIWAYIEMLMFYPLIIYVISKCEQYKLWKRVIVAVVGIIVLEVLTNMYVIVFVLGVIIAKYKLYIKADKWLDGFKINKGWIGLLSIVVAVVIRYAGIYLNFKVGGIFFNSEVIAIPIFVFGILLILHNFYFMGLGRLLGYVGRYSIYIWLVHTFYYRYYFPNLAMYPRYSILIALWVLILSLVTAIIIEFIYNRLYGMFSKTK